MSDRGPTAYADEKWETIARELHFQTEKEMLTTFYETMSIGKIADMFKVGPTTIMRRFLVHKIQPRKRGGPHLRSTQRYKMAHVDQRLIMTMGLTFCSRYLGVSNASLYKYKQWKQLKTGGKMR